MNRVAVIGDSFTDEYVFGTVERISPEAPVPVLDVERREIRGGGAINVANNLYSLGMDPVLFSITEMEDELPYEVRSVPQALSLRKVRFIARNFQLLRVDEPPRYRKEDLARVFYPEPNEFDIQVYVDYDKGYVVGGAGTIVDSKKGDLSVFRGTRILKINQKEFQVVKNADIFEIAFITRGPQGIDYYRYGKFIENSPIQAKEVIDVTGAGDTVTATLIYCLLNGITEPLEMMRFANKAAGIVVSKFGTSVVSKEELENEKN